MNSHHTHTKIQGIYCGIKASHAPASLISSLNTLTDTCYIPFIYISFVPNHSSHIPFLVCLYLLYLFLDCSSLTSLHSSSLHLGFTVSEMPSLNTQLQSGSLSPYSSSSVIFFRSFSTLWKFVWSVSHWSRSFVRAESLILCLSHLNSTRQCVVGAQQIHWIKEQILNEATKQRVFESQLSHIKMILDQNIFLGFGNSHLHRLGIDTINTFWGRHEIYCVYLIQVRQNKSSNVLQSI